MLLSMSTTRGRTSRCMWDRWGRCVLLSEQRAAEASHSDGALGTTKPSLRRTSARSPHTKTQLTSAVRNVPPWRSPKLGAATPSAKTQRTSNRHTPFKWKSLPISCTFRSLRSGSARRDLGEFETSLVVALEYGPDQLGQLDGCQQHHTRDAPAQHLAEHMHVRESESTPCWREREQVKCTLHVFTFQGEFLILRERNQG